MAQIMDWGGKAGRRWAIEWRRTDRSFTGLTERLLQRMRDFRFDSVLDIGCGAGELSLATARGRRTTPVVGIDISADLVDIARERGTHLSNVTFETCDAANWVPQRGFQPELLISRHGVMFFDDPVVAFRHLRHVAAASANLMFSCFRGPQDNEIFTGIGGLLPSAEIQPAPTTPGPMAFSDPDYVRTILSDAGWINIDFEPFDMAMVVGTGQDAVADAIAYFLAIGPAAQAAEKMGAAEREAYIQRLHHYLSTKEYDGIVALGAGAWIVTANKG